MGKLCDLMDRQLRIRGYSDATRTAYLHAMRGFVRHCMRPPDELTLEDVNQYRLHLARERKVAWSTFHVRVCALRDGRGFREPHTPVFMKNEARIEALFFLDAIALLVQGVLERELRAAMARDGIESLLLYPEERACRRPTAEQVLRLFAHVARHVVERPDGAPETFEPELTDLQARVLQLLAVPLTCYDRS